MLQMRNELKGIKDAIEMGPKSAHRGIYCELRIKVLYVLRTRKFSRAALSFNGILGGLRTGFHENNAPPLVSISPSKQTLGLKPAQLEQ